MNIKKQSKKEKSPSIMKFESAYSFTWKKMGNFVKIMNESAKNNKLLFFGMVFVTIFNSAIAAMLPIVSSEMVKLILKGEGATANLIGITMFWYSWLYIFLILFLVMLVLEYLTNLTIGLFSAKVEVAQRNKILISLVNQDVDFFFDHVSGNIMTRLVADTQGLSLGIQQFVTNLIYCLTGVIASVTIMLFYKQWLIAGISFGYLVVVIAIAVVIFTFFRRRMILAFDIKREVDTDMTDRIGNISLIKANGLEQYELDRLGAMNEKYNRAGDKVVSWSALLTFWINITTSLLSTVIIIVAAMMAVGGDAKIFGDLTLVLPLVGTMVVSIVVLVPTLRAASRAANSADRIGQLTEPIPTIIPDANAPEIELVDTIEFKDLVFAYPKKIDQIILPKMNLTFEKGKSYAFVGETGSGKSTIARLLLRFYDPIKGKVVINKTTDLKNVNLPSYLSHIGYVEQEPQIFFGDFFDNIRYSKFDATDEEIMEACKKAKLHDFILTLPEGYKTILGQRGFLLSGGQKQRLVIARVFLKNPDFIILDEATSALDNIVEKEIQVQLNELVKGKTSVTIAHRLSTIKNVDEIIVLGANGAGIVQRGAFEELIKTEGHFKKLYEAGLMK